MEPMEWTVPEWGLFLTIAGGVWAFMMRFVVRPQLRKAVEEGIVSERGIQAAIREKLPELNGIIELKGAVDRLARELAASTAHQAEGRIFMNDFARVIREEMKILSLRLDHFGTQIAEESALNQEHRDRNAQQAEAWRLELDRLTHIAMGATATAESLSRKVLKDADRTRKSDRSTTETESAT